MTKAKKILSLILIAVLAASCTSCGGEEDNKSDKVVIEQSEINSNGEIGDAGFEDGGETDLGSYWAVESSGSGEASVTDTESDEGSYALFLESTGHYTANVYQQAEGFEPGYYYMTVYTKNSDNHNACYVYANGTNQEQTMTSVPVNSEWTAVTVRGIEIGDDGKVTIGIYVDSNSGDSVYLDNIAITREANQESKYPSLFGGAVSRLTWEEDMGAKYYDVDGTEGDAIEIMASYGMNFARLELYNHPGKGRGDGTYYCPDGYQDPDDILSLAKRAKDAGMTLELTFFYTDYWSNECIPDEWAEAIEGKSEDEAVDILEDEIYEFTKDYMQQMADQGTTPEYVSLGNEIQGGILLPYGSYDKMENLARFLNAGYKAVKEVSESTQVILHISCNGDDVKWNGNGMGSWFFGLCEEYGVNYDIIGTSFYPYWSETLTVEDLTYWCNLMIDKFDKDIIVMESGYNWADADESGLGGQLGNNGAYEGVEGYESSPEGQRNFLIALINAIKTVKDGRCLGDLYWDPIFVEQEGCGWAIIEYSDKADSNVISNTTLFDEDHIALPGLDAYRFNVVGDSISENTVNYISDENGIFNKTITLKYYYEGDGVPVISFDNGEESEMEKFDAADPEVDYGDSQGDWYSYEINYSDGGFEILDGENVIITLNNYENADLYVNLLKGYYTYLYDGNTYKNTADAFETYYIAGSTDEWDKNDSGVFSGYWTEDNEWKDKLTENEDGTYSITLKGAKPGYTYVFNVYRNKDTNQKVFSVNQLFTVSYECDLIVTIDVENATVQYKVDK